MYEAAGVQFEKSQLYPNHLYSWFISTRPMRLDLPFDLHVTGESMDYASLHQSIAGCSPSWRLCHCFSSSDKAFCGVPVTPSIQVSFIQSKQESKKLLTKYIYLTLVNHRPTQVDRNRVSDRIKFQTPSISFSERKIDIKVVS